MNKNKKIKHLAVLLGLVFLPLAAIADIPTQGHFNVQIDTVYEGKCTLDNAIPMAGSYHYNFVSETGDADAKNIQHQALNLTLYPMGIAKQQNYYFMSDGAGFSIQLNGQSVPVNNVYLIIDATGSGSYSAALDVTDSQGNTCILSTSNYSAP